MYLKVCGMMQEKDIALCAHLGVDAVGIVVEFPQPNPWNLDRETGRRLVASVPTDLQSVLVCSGSVEFVASLATFVHPSAIQLHGKETIANTAALVRRLAPMGINVIKALRIDPVTKQAAGEIADPMDAARQFAATGVAGLVVDSRSPHLPGGTGIPVDVQVLKQIVAAVSIPVVAAGGLSPENVRAVIEAVQPYGVDVLSGVESRPGEKSAARIHSFCTAVRHAQVD